MRYRLPACILMTIALTAGATAQPPFGSPERPLAQDSRTERIDYAAIAQIRDEGLNRSQVMDHISWLSDVYGPRLTGGPGILQASDWAMKKFGEWGLANPHREAWPFGKGWSLVRFSAHLVEPQVQPLIGFPGSWSPSTKGTVLAEVVRVQIDSDADFEKYKGKLAGKIVLTQPERAVPMLEGTIVHRMGDKELAEAATTPIPRPRAGGPGGRGRGADPNADPAADDAAGGGRGGRGGAQSLASRIAQFFNTEGVVATFNRGGDSVMASVGSDLTAQQQHTDGGTIFPSGGGSRGADAGTGVPSVTLAVEHYNRMVRILAKNVPVKVELNIEAKFYDETAPNGFNTIAEIPGTDPALKDEVVMLGAHFDSVAAATGATDNATGSAAMMEAMRILKTIGVKPRRTIRIALWGGEEEGLLGSRAYVRDHFGDPATMALKPDHAKLAAYFNSDNGTGRVRGIWLQSNLAVRSIFEQWMEPLRDLGVVAVGPRSVASTDHASFDAVGLPGFQFMVDRLEYNSRTHHSNMDVYDRVQRDDMVQQATVIATFAYDAAMRDEKLPRKALPAPARGRGTVSQQ
jgi:carboxypeptidase Q